MLEKILDFFLKNIEKLPAITMWVIFFAVGGIVAFSAAFIRYKEFRDALINTLLLKGISARIDVTELLKNDLFLTRPLFERYISNILFTDKDKEWLFDTILSSKIESVLTHAAEFVQRKDIDTDSNVLKFQFNDNLNCMILKYEENILQQFVTKYGYECGNELFDYVYYEGFRVYHNTNIEHIIRAIEKISASKQPIQFKLVSYLLYLYVALDMAIFDCERVFKDFNGHITDIIKKHQK